MDGLSLDQFLVFVTVVDEGGFAAAARRLNRAQSAITYAVQKLEEQSGLQLFDRSGYRPALTEAGSSLLPRARRILDDVADFRHKARGIAEGLEAELCIVVDVLAPMQQLAEALLDLNRTFPTVQVRVLVESLEASHTTMMQEQVHLGLLIEVMPLTALERNFCCEFDLVAVASPGHPLAKLPNPLRPEHLQEKVQLVLDSKTAIRGERDYGVHSVNRWYLSDLAAKRALLLSGVGWGSMPRHLVADDIASGRLVELRPERWEGGDRMPSLAVVVAYRKGRVLGPAGRWLVQRMSSPAAGMDERGGSAED